MCHFDEEPFFIFPASSRVQNFHKVANPDNYNCSTVYLLYCYLFIYFLEKTKSYFFLQGSCGEMPLSSPPLLSLSLTLSESPKSPPHVSLSLSHSSLADVASATLHPRRVVVGTIAVVHDGGEPRVVTSGKQNGFRNLPKREHTHEAQTARG